jgi:hypothetical protein
MKNKINFLNNNNKKKAGKFEIKIRTTSGMLLIYLAVFQFGGLIVASYRNIS